MQIKKITYFIWIPLIVLILVGFIPFKVKKTLNESTKKAEVSSVAQIAGNCTQHETIEYGYYPDSNPIWKENNKFGLYIYAEEPDLFELAQKLVNSNGGKWGYVLIPYNVKDYDSTKWSRVFEQLSNKKLIPIIQLWDVSLDDYKEQTKKAAEFLNSFVWPIKYRYISVYNEPNDSKFWYGKVDPEKYAEVLDYTIKTFKSENESFFMLNGAFNISAPTNPQHMDAFDYLDKMNKKVPGIFEKLDGWASHPYPQPNFSGSPSATGRWSIQAYKEELAYLKNAYKVTKNLPVFITETGWAHAEGENYNSSYPPVEKVADYIKEAYEKVWLTDDRVRAVTPFTIRYNPPYDHFSWINKDNVPYLHYDIIKNMPKVEGKPPVLKVTNFEVGNCK